MGPPRENRASPQPYKDGNHGINQNFRKQLLPLSLRQSLQLQISKLLPVLAGQVLFLFQVFKIQLRHFLS